MARKNTETDMYQPVKELLITLGYHVGGEVMGCDIAAVKDDELLIVEMKLSFNMTLIFQALDRQKITEQVYVAIPRPRKAVSHDMSRIKEITGKLGLGLLTVALDSPVKAVDILVSPLSGGKKNERLKLAMKKELAGRSFDVNIGGSRGVKLNTAYRERCIRIACVLERYGPMSASLMVRSYGCEKDTYNILYQNHYGWFNKIKKGVYDLSKQGINGLTDESFSRLVQHYRKNI